MQAAGSPANMLHSQGQEQSPWPHCSMGRKSPLKMFHSGLRTSRLQAGHKGSTARFMQGLTACLGMSKRVTLAEEPDWEGLSSLALLPPLYPVLQTRHCHPALCRARRTGTWEGMEEIKSTGPPDMLQLPRDWRPRKAGGALSSLKNLMLVPYGPAYALLP